ncbi:hypothetical protein BCR37DRAFT_251542 [Protomyces lactucae-debilis]|uniref:TNase-like domain-containing protein n=1 Tax=Protomyces lactucae-debilis TaxID=2754530 RepID=A0A1Y2FNI9_PROLT|nr:uncharacterized protein BCR37DRAFT_251542 [Protomyces lactucae-debilis]ORY84786.1 hypothetical protein BCR37DRAFT_251542 [Protomyces lactucae-debilis]
MCAFGLTRVIHLAVWSVIKNASKAFHLVGMATVFRQGGTEYGGLMDAMERAEGVAKTAKKGMWSQGKKLETPAAYKKRTRGEDHEVVTSKTPKMAAQQKNSLLAWLKWSIGK